MTRRLIEQQDIRYPGQVLIVCEWCRKSPSQCRCLESNDSCFDVSECTSCRYSGMACGSPACPQYYRTLKGQLKL